MIIHLTGDLLLASRAGTAADAAGLDITTALSVAQATTLVARPESTGLLIDLETRDLDIAALVTALPERSRLVVIAYGPHVHERHLRAAQSAGCDAVLSRGQLDRDMAIVVRRLGGRTEA